MTKLFHASLLLACVLGVAAAAGDSVGPRKLRSMDDPTTQLDAETAKLISDALKAAGTPNLGPAAMPTETRPTAAAPANLEALVHAIDAAHAQRTQFVHMEALRRNGHRAHMATAGLTTFQQSKTTTPPPKL